MKKILFGFMILLALVLILPGCSSSRQSMHHHGVNNTGFLGY